MEMVVPSAETDFVGDFRRKTYQLHFSWNLEFEVCIHGRIATTSVNAGLRVETSQRHMCITHEIICSVVDHLTICSNTKYIVPNY